MTPAHLHQRGCPLVTKEHAVTWDPLLADDWPSQWSPFRVVVRPADDTIELVAEGHLDAWTVGALLRNLTAAYEPAFANIHIDLSNATGCDPSTDAGVARCREFAMDHRAGFRVTPPEIAVGDDPLLPIGHSQALGAMGIASTG
jgi:hypothetical protein